MELFTNVLYWISNGLLIPVIIALLGILFYAIMLLGSFYDNYLKRKKFIKSVKELEEIDSLKWKDLDYQEIFKGNGDVAQALSDMQKNAWDFIVSDKIISDHQAFIESQLNKLKILVRVGPMLGLMGTLIPMGPALVGLASGDIASMAVNMQVAFSTTVVGIFVGAIGFVINLAKSRWSEEECRYLEYIYKIVSKEGKNGL